VRQMVPGPQWLVAARRRRGCAPAAAEDESERVGGLAIDKASPSDRVSG
jgi:hypothetical protein